MGFATESTSAYVLIMLVFLWSSCHTGTVSIVYGLLINAQLTLYKVLVGLNKFSVCTLVGMVHLEC